MKHLCVLYLLLTISKFFVYGMEDMNYRIRTIKKSIRHNTLMNYLTLQDAIKLARTSRYLFTDMVVEVEIAEGKHRITKICTIEIPENIFHYLKYLVPAHISLQVHILQFNDFWDFPLNYSIFERLPQSHFSQHRLKLHFFLQTLVNHFNQTKDPILITEINEEMEGIYSIHMFGKTIPCINTDVLDLPLYFLMKKIQFEFHILASHHTFIKHGWNKNICQEITWISVKKVQMESDERWTICWTDRDNDDSMQADYIHDENYENEIRYLKDHSQEGFILKIRFGELLL